MVEGGGGARGKSGDDARGDSLKGEVGPLFDLAGGGIESVNMVTY